MHSLVAPLRELGFMVVSFDAPGHGVSGGSRVTLKQYADAVAAVLRTLGEVRVVLAHSLGTLAAIGALTADRPALDCVVLLAPTRTLAGVIDRWAPADIRVTKPLLGRVRLELYRRSGVPVDVWDVASLGAAIDCPVLAVHDPADPVVPFGDAMDIAATLPDARLVPVPGSGHIGILRASEVKAEVAAFVAAHTGRSEGVVS
jgi:pimeloyl-ACP methyl ester carboxylesterase